jgi:N-acetyl-alpha-D-muramate 1-phosphate uridylyltransferase
MDAMIFAAGLGTRLQPLTHDVPKALVEVGGVPMLEHVARRLVTAGADRLIINTHPFPDRIVSFVRARDGFGAEVRFSHEPDEPLDTGGGLRQAASLFRRDAPFFLHNCDVLSDIDLRALYAAHDDASALVTLAVLPPAAKRYLIFDDVGLCGYAPRDGGPEVLVREPASQTRRREFAGIHVVSPRLLDMLPPARIFSIISLYLTLAAQDERIATCEPRHARWFDIGSHEALARAEAALHEQSGTR